LPRENHLQPLTGQSPKQIIDSHHRQPPAAVRSATTGQHTLTISRSRTRRSVEHASFHHHSPPWQPPRSRQNQQHYRAWSKQTNSRRPRIHRRTAPPKRDPNLTYNGPRAGLFITMEATSIWTCISRSLSNAKHASWWHLSCTRSDLQKTQNHDTITKQPSMRQTAIAQCTSFMKRSKTLRRKEKDDVRERTGLPHVNS